MNDTLTAESGQEARLRPADEAMAKPLPAPGPFSADHDAAGAPQTLGALATTLLVLYPACASILIVLTGVLLAGPAHVA